MRKIKTGFMFVELLLVLVIIMFVVFKVSELYFKQSSPNQEAQKVILESGIDNTSYKSTINSTKNKIEDIQSKHFDELNNFE